VGRDKKQTGIDVVSTSAGQIARADQLIGTRRSAERNFCTMAMFQVLGFRFIAALALPSNRTLFYDLLV